MAYIDDEYVMLMSWIDRSKIKLWGVMMIAMDPDQNYKERMMNRH